MGVGIPYYSGLGSGGFPRMLYLVEKAGPGLSLLNNNFGSAFFILTVSSIMGCDLQNPFSYCNHIDKRAFKQ